MAVQRGRSGRLERCRRRGWEELGICGRESRGAGKEGIEMRFYGCRDIVKSFEFREVDERLLGRGSQHCSNYTRVRGLEKLDLLWVLLTKDVMGTGCDCLGGPGALVSAGS